MTTTQLKIRCPQCGAQGKHRAEGYLIKTCKRCEGTGFLHERPYVEQSAVVSPAKPKRERIKKSAADNIE